MKCNLRRKWDLGCQLLSCCVWPQIRWISSEEVFRITDHYPQNRRRGMQMQVWSHLRGQWLWFHHYCLHHEDLPSILHPTDSQPPKDEQGTQHQFPSPENILLPMQFLPISPYGVNVLFYTRFDKVTSVSTFDWSHLNDRLEQVWHATKVTTIWQDCLL